ncbi:alpha/beta hydrolase family protein [Paenibacillus abyssi]|uniref:Alpha/beta hydrolase n=1 Tax=Paenibacillus abyssi TaxID=1340531 RepID=A0A917CJ04_9BACL|nr:hypothetical protein [Paenibacillus abyssi]GGF90306.1 hypothetical protein GCM10010916_04610 [Paenibacillus abyssi]
MNQLKKRLQQLPDYDSAIYVSGMIGFNIIIMLLFFETGWNMPTGFGPAADALFILLICFAGNALLFLFANVVCLVLIWLPFRMPKLLTGLVTGAVLLFSKAFTYTNMNVKGAALLTGFMLLFGIASGIFCYLAFSKQPKTLRRRMTISISGLLLGVMVYFITGAYGLHDSSSKPVQQIEPTAIQQVQAENPALAGPYEVRYFTYGSGKDLRRKEFAEEAELITAPVDASAFITNWNKWRTRYWGFDPQSFPLNGRVWLPQGEGPFPVVLIVHGNHTMEDFSDEGYGYLGELLASRGFLTVSIDENFINYSTWTGIPNDDYPLRTWILLQHLQALDQISRTAGNVLFGKADFDKIALIGHSRGGQAAALAADYDTFYRAAGEDEMMANIHYPIDTIIAIAPTDRKLEDKYVKLNDVNYLVLHGSYDSDVTTFDGDRQYDRVSFSDSGASQYMKASLYIEHANHGQFNTTWGKMDIKLPARFLFNTRDMLPEGEQQFIAQTYISAFLESTLHEDKRYIPMFKDWQNAKQWLPETGYLSRFKSSDMVKVADFEEDKEKITASMKRARIAGTQLRTWEEQEKRNRHNVNRLNRAVLLSWNNNAGRYSISLPSRSSSGLSHASSIVFSLAHDSDVALEKQLDFSIQLTTSDGVTVALPMHKIRPIHPVFMSRYLNAGPLAPYVKNGRLKTSTESVFQDYFIPLSEFVTLDKRFDPSRLDKIEWVFDQTATGAVFLDDIYLEE